MNQPTARSLPLAPSQKVCGFWNGFAALITLGSAMVYGLTRCPFPYPVESAGHLARHAGLDPLRTLLDPLWGLAVRCILGMAGPNAVSVLNLILGLPLAALTLMLVFYAAVNMRHEAAEEVPSIDSTERRACLVSAWTAAIFLATSAPFWFVATRAHPAAWHAALLAGVAGLLVAARLENRPSLLGFAAFLTGVGSFSAPAMLWALPLVAAYALFLLFVKGWLVPHRVFVLAACFLAGAAVVLLALLPYRNTAVFEWREFAGFAHLLQIFLRDHLMAARALTAGTGWMIGILTMVLPWFAAVAWPALNPRHRLNESASFHLVLAVLAVILVLDVTLSPWAVLQLNRLVLIPYLFASLWIGHMAGFWWRRLQEAPYGETLFRFRLRRVARRLYLPLLVLLGAVGAWRHGRAVWPAQALPAVVLAEGSIAALPDGAWLISNGVLDDNLAWAAHQQGKTVHVLNLARSRNPVYARYLESLADTPRMRTLAELGPLLMLAERLDQYPEDAVGVQDRPGILTRHGRDPIPEAGLYIGRRPGGVYDIEAAHSRHEVFWSSLEAALSAARHAPTPVHHLNDWVGRSAARLANDLGVAWEDRERADLADQAYRAALRFDPDNVSALLNAMALAETEGRPEGAALQERVERLLERAGDAASFWALAETYGMVRRPQAYVAQGWLWAQSGRPDLAARQLEQVDDAGQETPGLRMALAALYFQMEQDEQSESHYRAVLLRQPANTSALLGLGRIAMRRGDVEGALSFFHQVLEQNPGSSVAATELGILAFLQGDPEEADRRFRAVLEADPGNIRALYLLGFLAREREDREQVREWESRLAALQSPDAVLARASLAMADRRYAEARSLLLPLTEQAAYRVSALALLLRMDVAEGDAEAATLHARALLELDVGDTFANLIMGSLQAEQGRFADAEASFRAVLRRQPSAEAHNSLAWVLAEQGDLRGGLREVRQALSLDPDHGPAWDTLGVILHRLGRIDQAVVALRRGVEANPQRVDFKVHLAEALRDAGQVEESQALARQALEQLPDAPSPLRTRFETLLR